jgi:peptide/nickel transport system permease protein
MDTTQSAAATHGVTLETREAPVESVSRMVLKRFLRDKLAVSAFIVLLLFVLIAVSAPLLSDHVTRHDPNLLDLSIRFEPPNSDYWLGTDDIGRDVATRLIYGARVSLSIGLIAGLVAVAFGSLLGALAGYFGGFVDDAISALIDTVLALPTIFLLILLSTFVRPSPLTIALIIGMVSWMGVARLVRGGVLAVKERDFITASEVAGASNARIIWRHILPNVASTIIVVAYIDIANAILAESALSFLGLGVQPPDASWGNMLQDSLSYLFREPFLIFPPGLLIFVTVLCLYVLGDGLRDALDPQVKE